MQGPNLACSGYFEVIQDSYQENKGKCLNVSYPNKIKLESLKGTREFYIWKLKDKKLTEKQRDSYLTALETIEKIIKKEENSRKIESIKRY